MAPKSILKSVANSSQSQESERQQRAREVAIHHANIIQQQKDAENQIFEALEDLIDFPLTEGVTAEKPSPSDIKAFQMLVAPFRPQDFDELILERNLADKCGYVFCPNEPKPETAKGKSRILGKSSVQSLRIVDSNKVTRWCSDECAIRAVHIKVQLNTEPAWLRIETSPTRILPLIGTVDDNADLSGTADLGSNLDQIRSKMDQLALERGEDVPSAKNAIVSNDIVEKAAVDAPDEPSIDGEGMHDMIEGYQPKNAKKHELGDRDWDV